MSAAVRAGTRFSMALKSSSGPLQCLGTVNAYSARLAEAAGVQSIYLSGSGVATASYGLPDLGITNVNDVCEDIRRITSVTNIPLLVDIDTGFGSALCIRRCIQDTIKAGAACVHMEDQAVEKRCGHRPGKQIVSTEEMVHRITVAHETRQEVDPEFRIMARTDALASEGLESCLKRCEAYLDAGADMLFPEAFTELQQYRTLSNAFPGVPILANITEFGKTPLYTTTELGENGVSIVLYPLSAHRAMAQAAYDVYSAIIKDGTQENVLGLMQTRKELYEFLDYQKYEDILDDLVKKK